VFWVHAGTQARFKEGYRRIAEATKMHGWKDLQTDIEILRLVHAWLCDASNGRWVMVVDNADDLDVFFASQQSAQIVGAAQPLFDFLPQSPNGAILFTSRVRDIACELTGEDLIVNVGPMGKDEALTLLQKKLGLMANKEEAEAVKLINTLDSMPLALAQAAAFIKRRHPRMSVAKYVEEVHRHLLKPDIRDMRRDSTASNSIVATWRISFEHIQKSTPTAAQLLSLMSLFDRQGIPERLLRCRYQESNDTDADFEDDIHMLLSYSLIEMTTDESQFEMHGLVQFSTKKWLEHNQELEPWKVTYVSLMDSNYPVGHFKNWPVCRALFPHAQAAVDCRPADKKAQMLWASVMFKAAWYAREMGQYRVAEDMNYSALNVRIDLLGKEHPVTLRSMGNLASTYRNQGRWKEAEKLHVQVMETGKRMLGEEHPDTLTSMGNLALTYRNQGRWNEAEELQVQAMETEKRVLGEEHPDTLTSMGNLASTYMNQGRWKEAEELQVQVIETRKRVLRKEHPSTLTSIGNLALTYMNQGRWKETEELEV
jgi:tetratricopeptide (TPR) repeat protein